MLCPFDGSTDSVNDDGGSNIKSCANCYDVLFKF